MLAGGWNESSQLTEEQYNMVLELQPQVHEHANQEFHHFHPVAIKSQVVAGTNFFVKIQVGEHDYIHVKIFRPLPHTGEHARVTEVHTGKTLEDAI